MLLADPTGRQIHLRNVGRRDAGLYICKADNAVNEGVEKVTRITVNYMPEMRLEEVWVPSPRGKTFEVRLICHVHAHPTAQVVWFKNDHTRLSTSDKLLIEDKKGGGSTLRIEQLLSSQFGQYKCRASNPLGREERRLRLSGRPRPPLFSRDQREILSSVKAVNLTWSTDSLSPVTQYSVHYRKSQPTGGDRPEEGSSWLQAVMPVAAPDPRLTTTASYTLRELDNESVYDVRVRAINKFGMSNFSKVFNFYVKTALSAAEAPEEPDFASPRFLQTETKEPGPVPPSSAPSKLAMRPLLLLVMVLLAAKD